MSILSFRSWCVSIAAILVMTPTAMAATVTKTSPAEDIWYEKRLHFWPVSQSSYSRTSDNPRFPQNVPYILEYWVGSLNGIPVSMQRNTQTDGKRLFQRLDFFLPGDDLMIHPEETFWWWEESSTKTPICIYMQDPPEPHKEEEDPSTYVPEEETSALFNIEDFNPTVRASALRTLLAKGIFKELPAERDSERIFRVDITSNYFDENGEPIGEQVVIGYNRYVIKKQGTRIVSVEWFSLDENGTPQLVERVRHLGKRMISSKKSATVFNAQRYGLVTPWSQISVSRKDIESGKAKQGCYIDGTWVSDNDFELRDLISDHVADRAQWLQLAAPISGDR